jgi:hypothetical protein
VRSKFKDWAAEKKMTKDKAIRMAKPLLRLVIKSGSWLKSIIEAQK